MNFWKNVLSLNPHYRQTETAEGEMMNVEETNVNANEKKDQENDLMSLFDNGRVRNPAELKVIDSLMNDKSNGEEKMRAVLLLENNLRSHPTYGMYFHDHENGSSASTDDPHLSLDLSLIYRILKAKKFKINDAMKYVTNWIDWRLKEQPHKIQLEEVWEEYITGKGYWWGVDKNGLPICVLNPQYHDPTKRDFEQCRRFGIYIAEEGLNIMRQRGKEKCVMIYDASNVTLKTLDIAMFQALVEIFTMYPEFLEYAIVITSFTFFVLWKIGEVFMDQTTKEKLRFVESTKNLLDMVDREYLPREYGGTSNFNIFEHVARMEKPNHASPITDDQDKDTKATLQY